ncbi:hypothetical protein B0H14DRAFT_89759 [Mycena olivaceomarginata]|nr:hypothetical protein B0H14DRAFT_89759 [Mycena olivaceomarginata]
MRPSCARCSTDGTGPLPRSRPTGSPWPRRTCFSSTPCPSPPRAFAPRPRWATSSVVQVWCVRSPGTPTILSLRRHGKCLSLTPTLLTGDRTLVDVVVHEFTHSWFGNGVTHAHATHFWLNEGWTVYMERLLLQVLHGSPAFRGFSYIIGAKALRDDLERYAGTPRYPAAGHRVREGRGPGRCVFARAVREGLESHPPPRANPRWAGRVPPVREGLRAHLHRHEHHDGAVEGSPVRLFFEKWRAPEDQIAGWRGLGYLALRRGRGAARQDDL